MADPTPHPRRFRWLLRCTVALVVVLVVLTGVRLVWGQIWHGRFEAELQAIRDRGEPIDVNDFNPPPLADANNAAVFLRRAMQAWPGVPNGPANITDTDWYMDPDQHPDPITDNTAYLASAEPALTLMDQAARAPDSRWGGTLRSPVINHFNMGPYLGELRGLARQLEDAAQRAMDDGQPAVALGLTRRAYGLSASLQPAPVSLIDDLVAISIRALSFGLIEEILPQLDVAAADPAVAAELRLLLEVMRDETTIDAAHQQSMYYERMFNQDTVRAVADGTLPLHALTWGSSSNSNTLSQAQRWLLKPLYYRDGCIMLDYLTRLSDSAHLNDPHLHERIEVDFEHLDDERWRSPLAGVLMPALGAARWTRFQSVTQHRLARTAVALKLFEFEQRRPAASLDELVPDYLAAVPLDPMDPAGRAIRYAPDGGAVVMYYAWSRSDDDGFLSSLESRGLPLLYSVGRDGNDDGGLIGLDDEGVPADLSRFRGRDDDEPSDQWFLLAPMPEPIANPNAPPNQGYGGPGGYPGFGG